MIVFRLGPKRYSHDLSGSGAKLFGGRWNSVGSPMLYTAGSRTLALIECTVHLESDILPDDHEMVEIEIPDDVAMTQLERNALPVDWGAQPPSRSTIAIGDEFLRSGKYLVLRVPSVIVPEELNYVINPLHPEARLLRVVSSSPFKFDSRLLRM